MFQDIKVTRVKSNYLKEIHFVGPWCVLKKEWWGDVAFVVAGITGIWPGNVVISMDCMIPMDGGVAYW